MSWWSSALSSMGGSFSLDDATLGWANNQSNRSLNKAINKTNLKLQKQYDLWTQEQDKAYEKWYQDYMYSLQNNEYYKLAQKYATNTAKWAVQGLKAAGLNPILAAQNPNMSSNLGDARPSGSGHSVGGSPSLGSVGASRSGMQLRLNQQADAVTQQQKAVTAKEQADTRTTNESRPAVLQGLNANNAKTLAESDLISAQAEEVRVRTKNEAKNEGLGGVFGATANVTHKIYDALSEQLEGVSNKPSSAKDSVPSPSQSPRTDLDAEIDRLVESLKEERNPSEITRQQRALSDAMRDRNRENILRRREEEHERRRQFQRNLRSH